MKPTLIYYNMLQYQPKNLALLQEHFQVSRLPDPSHDTPELLARADVLMAPLGYFVGPEKIDACPRLRAIGSNTTGHPHIDVNYARSRGIAVATLKGETEFLNTITPTAELTWGLVIALTRNILPANRSVMEGRWDRRPFGGRAMLSSMSLGVAGYGRLGRMVARYGLCFGMRVMAYDPFVDSYEPGVERLDSLEALVGQSDVVSIHIPHEPETENLFDAALLDSFSPGAFLVNTSRGELMDHAALLKGLASGSLAGAALDVFEDEFTPGFDITGHPLWTYARDHDNLILTPHIGGSTRDAWGKTEEFTIRKILQLLESGGN